MRFGQGIKKIEFFKSIKYNKINAICLISCEITHDNVDKCCFLYYVFCVRKEYLCYLFFSCVLLGSLFLSCDDVCVSNSQKKTVKKAVAYRRPVLTFRTDTIIIDETNYDSLRKHGAGGCYFPKQNVIAMKWYQTKSKNVFMKRFCDTNNALYQLNLRHEKEHALKYEFTSNIQIYSALVRGEIVAMNETVAPASEIIEAIDYRYKNGHSCPCVKAYIASADSAVMNIIQQYNMSEPVNFNFRPIADIVIKYSVDRFCETVKRGYYINAIQKAYCLKNVALCSLYDSRNFSYNPSIGLWGPMWKFSSMCGPVNIYDSASPSMRLYLINKIDSVINNTVKTGNLACFYKNCFLYYTQ